MTALPDGRFAVRDNFGIRLFDEDGLFLRSLAEEASGNFYFGLATDGTGHLYTISVNDRGK